MHFSMDLPFERLFAVSSYYYFYNVMRDKYAEYVTQNVHMAKKMQTVLVFTRVAPHPSQYLFFPSFPFPLEN